MHPTDFSLDADFGRLRHIPTCNYRKNPRILKMVALSRLLVPRGISALVVNSVREPLRLADVAPSEDMHTEICQETHKVQHLNMDAMYA